MVAIASPKGVIALVTLFVMSVFLALVVSVGAWFVGNDRSHGGDGWRWLEPAEVSLWWRAASSAAAMQKPCPGSRPELSTEVCRRDFKSRVIFLKWHMQQSDDALKRISDNQG